MRLAELIMALVMAAFSVYLMWKSTELPIGWIPGEGPGGGAFPFWLASGMLLCCVAILYNWVRRLSPPAQSEDVFMDSETVRLVGTVAVALTIMIGAIHFVGVYISVPLFMAFYMRFLGRHSWRLISGFVVLTPIVTFFFFEIALRKTLPKGVTEEFFYPLYDLFL